MEPAPSRRRIFISYSSRDIAVAEALQGVLESMGFEVWRDKGRLESDWSREIAQALAASDMICVVWSLAASSSVWVKHEWLTARALEKPIIPCLLGEAPDLPGPLVNLQGVKLDSWSDGGYAPALLKRIQGQTDLIVKYDYTILPPNSFIPFTPNPQFVGRHDDLLRLYLNLVGNLNRIGISQVGCFGMGGSGKTQLAVEFAYRFSHAFEGVYWVQAADKEQWTAELVRIARHRLQLLNDRSPESLTDEDYLFALQIFLKAHPGHLIIMDNVTDPLQLNNENVLAGHLTPLVLGASLLFTSRRRVVPPGVIAQLLDVLPADAAYDLLVANRRPDSPEETGSAQSICNAVGYLPLALILAAGYLNKYRAVSYAEYQGELLVNRLDTIDIGGLSPEELSTRHDAAVATTLKNQWSVLEDVNAKTMLLLMSLFPESAIVEQARIIFLGDIPQGRSPLDRPAERAILLLSELNLVEYLEKERSLRIHPLIHSFLRQDAGEAALLIVKEQVGESLMRLYNDPEAIYAQMAALGIDAVIDDLAFGLEIFPDSAGATKGKLGVLYRLLDNERRCLQDTGGKRFFFQQMLYRAVLRDTAELSALYGTLLDDPKEKALRIYAVSAIPNQSLVRWIDFDDTDGNERGARVVRFSESGRYAMICSWKKIRYCDVSSGKVVAVLTGHTERIMDVRFFDNDSSAVSVDGDGVFVFWDLQKGEFVNSLKPLEGHIPDDHSIYAARIDKDGGYAILSYDNRDANPEVKKAVIAIVNLESGDVLYEMPYDYYVDSVLINAAQNRAGWGHAQENAFFLWQVGEENMQRLESEYVYKDFENNGIKAIRESGDGERLVAIVNGCVMVRAMDDPKTERLCESRSPFVFDAAFSPDKRFLLAGFGKSLELINLDKMVSVRRFSAHSNAIRTIDVHPDGNAALTGAEDGVILWQIDYLSLAEKPDGHQTPVAAVYFSADGTAVFTCAEDQLIKWDVRSGKMLQMIDMPAEIFVTDLRQEKLIEKNESGAFDVLNFPVIDVKNSVDGNLLAFSLIRGGVYFWKDVEKENEWVGFGVEEKMSFSMAFSPDGKYLVLFEDDFSIVFWDLALMARAKRVVSGMEGAAILSISPEQKTMALGYKSGSVLLFDFETCDRIGELHHGVDKEKRSRFDTIIGSGEEVRALTLLPGGKKAIICFTDDTPVLWDFERQTAVIKFAGHSEVINDIVVDNARGLLWTADGANTLMLWDLNTGKMLNKLLLEGVVGAMALCGDCLVIGDLRGQVSFLRV